MKEKILILFVMVFCIGCDMQKTDKQNEYKYTSQIFAMDTVMDLTVYDIDGEKAIAAAEKKIREFEKLFSVNRKESDIYRINHDADSGQPISVSEDTFRLIKKSIELSEKTGGMFDISIFPIVKAWGFTSKEYRVPEEEERNNLKKLVDYRKIRCKDKSVLLDKGMRLDLGGIAKGYAADEVIDLFRNMGMKSAIVSLGGDIKTLGTKPNGESFQIAIKNPLEKGSFLDTIPIKNRAVVTSGSYDRSFEKGGKNYHHIMDKRTAAPVNSDLISVTVIADHSTDADGLSTALFTLGSEKAVELHKSLSGFDMILLRKDGKIIRTDS